jgi:hypothetical protein
MTAQANPGTIPSSISEPDPLPKLTSGPHSANSELEVYGKAFEPVHMDGAVEGLEADEVKQALGVREAEAQLENERPCVFKSLSPVRPCHFQHAIWGIAD